MKTLSKIPHHLFRPFIDWFDNNYHDEEFDLEETHIHTCESFEDCLDRVGRGSFPEVFEMFLNENPEYRSQFTSFD